MSTRAVGRSAPVGPYAATLASWLHRPPNVLRLGCALAALLLMGNTLWHGQSYAVGLVGRDWNWAVLAALNLVLSVLVFFCAGARRPWLAVLVCFCFGALAEVMQGLAPGRTPDFNDWLVSAVAALLGVAFMAAALRATRRWLPRRR